MRTGRSFAAFLAVSLLSFAVDWSAFAALLRALPDRLPGRLFASVAAARALSLVFNYVCNRRFVFPDGARTAFDRVSFARYLALAGALLAGSWASLRLVAAAAPRIPLPAAKPAVDAALFLVSFAVQRAFVFRRPAPPAAPPAPPAPSSAPSAP